MCLCRCLFALTVLLRSRGSEIYCLSLVPYQDKNSNDKCRVGIYAGFVNWEVGPIFGFDPMVFVAALRIYFTA